MEAPVHISLRRLRLERQRLAVLLRTETFGGALLVAAAIAAMVVANSPLERIYANVRDWRFGPAALDLHLSVQAWTADGLLAIFFFLAGLELKRELVDGELRDPRRALVPIAAAVGGMAAPALIYLAINASNPGAEVGWAIPTATDIAFALAVLAVIGRHLPSALRLFLLTLAVVDDLLAIVIIALFYTQGLRPGLLLLALLAVAAFTAVAQRFRTLPRPLRLTLAPLALIAWGLMHASGVHATVAGVLMGFAIPILGRRRGGRRGRIRGPKADAADRLDKLLRPISAAVAVPLFAFFAAGVHVGGAAGLAAALGSRVALGVMVGMVVGKTVGILLATLLTAHLVRSPLLRSLALSDLVGLSVLGGVGFTVSLLIGHLAFGSGTVRGGDVQIAVLTGSLAAALLAAIVLGLRNRHYRAMRLP